MQPDIAKIEHHINAVGDMLHSARALEKRTQNSPKIWAELHIHDPAQGMEDSLILNGRKDKGAHMSAHDRIELEMLTDRAVQEGLAIREELRKCPLLDYDALDLNIDFCRPAKNWHRISFWFDGIGLGGEGANVKSVCEELKLVMNAYSKVPPKALNGLMRKFSVNGGSAAGNYAPSAQALLFKRNTLGLKTHSIEESLDPKVVQQQLEAMSA